MTPRVLGDWSVEAILDILAKGLFETEDFDSKEALPDSRDAAGKARLRGACCALANSYGGFLVFGVANDRSLSPPARLVGVSHKLDFPEHFGSHPQHCIPAVDWSFRNPPLALGLGRVVHIVHIPKSWKAPHSVGSAAEGWRFLKRTNKGDEGMSMEEIRASFLGFYEKRLRLALLRAELVGLQQIASSVVAVTDPKMYSLVTFDIAVVESIIADTYPLTAGTPQFLESLAQLRYQVRIANNKSRVFFNIVEGPLTTGRDEMLRSHKEYMAARCVSIMALCASTIEALDQILAGGGGRARA